MTTISQRLTKLFRALAAEDIPSARATAAQICKDEERKGHNSSARLLRGALNAGGRGAVSIQRPALASAEGEFASPISTALVALRDRRSLPQVVLPATVRQELEELIHEWKFRALLEVKHIPRRAKLLFHGPPGCGKSITAAAIASELGLPIYLVRFDAVIGAYLGQTAIRLREIFHFAESTACVLLLDELDALGKRRGNPLDVGELDRIVISLLQELEHSRPAGLVIATTNMAQHLDDALWRRFDLAIKFPSPSRAQLSTFVSGLSKERGVQLSRQAIERIRKAASFAEAERIVIGEARRQLLAGR